MINVNIKFKWVSPMESKNNIEVINMSLRTHCTKVACTASLLWLLSICLGYLFLKPSVESFLTLLSLTAVNFILSFGITYILELYRVKKKRVVYSDS